MRAMIMVLGMALAAACAPMPVEQPAASASQSTVVAEAPQPASTEGACKAQGGSWQPVCLLGKQECVVTFKDAGKSCTDGSQCSGRLCVTSGMAQPDAPAQGQCTQTSNPCGCRQTVTNGKAGYPLCVD